jgi:hypothetical protein
MPVKGDLVTTTNLSEDGAPVPDNGPVIKAMTFFDESGSIPGSR